PRAEAAVLVVLGDLLAYLDELDVGAHREQRTLATGEADASGSDLVDVDEHGAGRVEHALVAAQEGSHSVGERLLGAGQKHPEVELLEVATVAPGELECRRDARGVVVRSWRGRGEGDVHEQR